MFRHETMLNSNRICILDIEIEGVKQIKKSDLNPYYIFIKPHSMEELEARLKTRGTETKELLQKRISSARREMEYGEKPGNFHLRSLERKKGKTCLMDAHAVEIRIKNDMGSSGGGDDGCGGGGLFDDTTDHGDLVVEGNDDYYYVVSVPRPKVIGVNIQHNEALESYLSSTVFLIALDLKQQQQQQHEPQQEQQQQEEHEQQPPPSNIIANEIEKYLKEFFESGKLLNLFEKRFIFYKRNENETRKEFLTYLDSYIESLLRSQKIKYDDSIVFNYVSDNCEGYEESFEIENLKFLTKSAMVFHSNFIFVNDLLETDDAPLEEEEITTDISEKAEEGSEEKAKAEEKVKEEEEAMEIDISFSGENQKDIPNAIIAAAVANSSTGTGIKTTTSTTNNSNNRNNTTTTIAPSANRYIPAMMNSFINFRNNFFSKGLNTPSLYVLKNQFELKSFFVDFFRKCENYYFTLYPGKLISNAKGFCFAEDGSISKEVDKFNFDDFIVFKKEDFKNLKILLRDARGNIYETVFILSVKKKLRNTR
ncbi:Guanylate kinase [Armadillidium vulgare]|nr:Guanylate kinase [Armadillidium vulgare]